MCVVSMVHDWGQHRWPDSTPKIPDFKPWTPGPNQTVPVENFPTRKEWEEFKDLIKRAIEYDKRTNQPDCVDPEKDAWMKRIEERLDALEKYNRSCFD